MTHGSILRIADAHGWDVVEVQRRDPHEVLYSAGPMFWRAVIPAVKHTHKLEDGEWVPITITTPMEKASVRGVTVAKETYCRSIKELKEETK